MVRQNFYPEVILRLISQARLYKKSVENKRTFTSADEADLTSHSSFFFSFYYRLCYPEHTSPFLGIWMMSCPEGMQHIMNGNAFKTIKQTLRPPGP